MNDKPQNKVSITVIKNGKSKRVPAHPLYYAFCNAKSVAIELARQIAKEAPKPLSNDVQRFLDEFDSIKI